MRSFHLGFDNSHPRSTGRLMRAMGAVALVGILATGCGSSGNETASGGEPATEAAGAACTGHRTAEVQDWIEPLEPAPTPQLPVTITDFSEQEVTVTDTTRILALDRYGTLATTVYALGFGDNLIGRDTSTLVPDLADLPVVTQGGHNLNAEAIMALNPSVILTDYSIGPYEVQMQLRNAGIPVVFFDSERSSETVSDQIEAVGIVLGVDDAAKELAARVEADIVAAKAEVAELAANSPRKNLRMVFLYLRGQAGVFYWFGEGTGADDLIEAMGGIDVADEVDVEAYIPINAEGMVKAAPDMILLMTGGLESVNGVEGLKKIAGVGQTSAGQNECVVDMADGQILGFGPQYPMTIRAMGAAIYGEGAS